MKTAVHFGSLEQSSDVGIFLTFYSFALKTVFGRACESGRNGVGVGGAVSGPGHPGSLAGQRASSGHPAPQEAARPPPPPAGSPRHLRSKPRPPQPHTGGLCRWGGGPRTRAPGHAARPRPQCPRPARRVSFRGAPVPVRPAASASWAATAPSLVSGSQGEEGPTRPCPASEPAAAPRCARVPTGPART